MSDSPTDERPLNNMRKSLQTSASCLEEGGSPSFSTSPSTSSSIAKGTDIFWSSVQHEICESVEATHTGGQLGSKLSCKQCRKNPNHENFIRACEFKRSDCDIWEDKNLPPYLHLDDLFELIKCLIPQTARLQSTFVSTDRPDKPYPLSDRRGRELKGFRNVGSGLVFVVLDMKYGFGCETCKFTWRVNPENNGMYSCKRDGCPWSRRWRPRSEEDGKCPECMSDSVEVGGRIFQCTNDRCVYSDTCKWKVVEDSEVCTCPWCGEEWWRVGEEEKPKCPKCGGTGRKGCVCDDCVNSEDRKYQWWVIGIATARHVIYDVNELKSCEVVFFDDGRDQPLKLDVGKSGFVSEANTENDEMTFEFYTHDSTLAEKRRKLMGDYRKVEKRIKNKIREVDEITSVYEMSKDRDVFHPGFLVGYPHGRHCYVTLGQMLGWSSPNDPKEYLIDSCVGNSGCLVPVQGLFFAKHLSCHSGASQDKQVGEKKVGTSCTFGAIGIC